MKITIQKPFFRTLLFTFLAAGLTVRAEGADLSSYRPVSAAVPVIFDTDIGNSTDDMFALMILYRLMDMGYVDIKGINVDRMGDGYADIADIMNTYYGHPDIPIGIERNGIIGSQIFIDYRLLDELKNKNGSKMYKRTDRNMQDNLEGYKLYRKILREAEDHSVRIVSTGFISTIVHLLESQPDEYSPLTGADLVARKVDALYMMGTHLGENSEPCYNLRYDIPAAGYFAANWPASVPVYISPDEVGRLLDYEPQQVIADLSYDETSPIRQVYLNTTCDAGQRMWDPLCVENMLFPGRFEFSPKGHLLVGEHGGISFVDDPNGTFCHQLPGDQAWVDDQMNYLRAFAMMR